MVNVPRAGRFYSNKQLPGIKCQFSSRDIQQFRSGLLQWFKSYGRPFPWRAQSANTYQRIVSEVLLQRTRAETIADFFPKFVREFTSWRKLSSAKVSRLQEFLKPIGLWRRRAVSIRNLALEVAKRRGRFPKDRHDIESLPGVGQYIANSILLFYHGEPRPLLDVNMARVLERYFGPRTLADIRYDPYLQQLAMSVVQGNEPVSLNWAILDLAALVCKSKVPRCKICPLATSCKERARLARRTGP